MTKFSICYCEGKRVKHLFIDKIFKLLFPVESKINDNKLVKSNFKTFLFNNLRIKIEFKG